MKREWKRNMSISNGGSSSSTSSKSSSFGTPSKWFFKTQRRPSTISFLWNVRRLSKVSTVFSTTADLRLDLQNVVSALCGYPLLKLEIRDSCQISTAAAIFFHYNYFRQTIWRLASVQFHFWYIYLGTSWTQPTAEEGFTIESVSIQPGCRKNVTKI